MPDSTAAATADSTAYLLVDGENIDATLGMSVLGRRPLSEERPRWDRILHFTQLMWSEPARGLFFLNASSGQMPMSFIQALLAMSYQPIPLAGEGSEKVVDIGIQRTMDAILAQGSGDVVLASHDGDYIPQVAALLDAGRRVSVVCFREFLNAQLAELTGRGLQVFDLEDDLRAFNAVLPRVRIIPLAAFDPTRYL
ncbi:NYN domain-containing protein [Georgenia sp. TF02-10]|uniref:NYN domain-containing protein n=1 Tax=Georgenia sp. TF02-10 TaxID=2917725 RepID=UPI001FA7DB9E|nr:NYN domain-containing protein [Georgenia sp. TF02-10]UNX55319.1 NYN domain-containing protein [Georgenia sp. TF02-10]